MDDRTSEFVFVGFWKRVLAGLIDTAVTWLTMPIIIPMMVWSFQQRTILPITLWSIGWTVLIMWLIVRFGGTVGKLIIGVRIVDVEGNYLSWLRAFRRVLFPSLMMTLVYILQFWQAFRTYPDDVTISGWLQMGMLMNEYGEPYVTLASIITFTFYIDILTILTNSKKRAIHDFIAGSYVITKTSFKELGEVDGETYPSQARTEDHISPLLG